MRVVVAVVGKPRDSALAAAIMEYETRAARYWPLEVHEVREERGRLPPKDVVAREGERLTRAIPARAKVVACDASGESMTSEKFASWLQKERDGANDLVFLIGGANGLSPDIRQSAKTCLSMSHWTMQHELARLVLAEQLYRAGTIIRGEPYHK